MMYGTEERLRQRADYTHKFNAGTGRFGWLRLTPAYSVKVVEEIVEGYGAGRNVLDPFCGTGTTALSAVNHGHDAATTDINPFLVWLARAKTAHYSPIEIAEAREAGESAVEMARSEKVNPVPEPPIYKIERWWSVRAGGFLLEKQSETLRHLVVRARGGFPSIRSLAPGFNSGGPCARGVSCVISEPRSQRRRKVRSRIC